MPNQNFEDDLMVSMVRLVFREPTSSLYTLYSVMQSDRNSFFCGDFVNMIFRADDSFNIKFMKSKNVIMIEL